MEYGVKGPPQDASLSIEITKKLLTLISESYNPPYREPTGKSKGGQTRMERQMESRDMRKKKRKKETGVMSTVKSRCRAPSVPRRAAERNSCAHKIRRSGNLQAGFFANKISSRVKRSRLAWAGGLFGRAGIQRVTTEI